MAFLSPKKKREKRLDKILLHQIIGQLIKWVVNNFNNTCREYYKNIKKRRSGEWLKNGAAKEWGEWHDILIVHEANQHLCIYESRAIHLVMTLHFIDYFIFIFKI